jgi:glycosyltransferase involved in cell wall biosynthesis
LKVSVVIPAYRAERFLGEALESVANQTHPDWEVLVHEDGVFDESARIINAFSLKHPGRVHHSATRKNRGVSQTRNRLMDAATGDVIAFLDADDLWCSNHLERALSAMSQSGSDWYVAGMKEVDSVGNSLGSGKLPPTVGHNELSGRLLAHNFIPTSLAVLGPRVVEGKFRFDPSLKVGEDLDLWIRLVGSGLYPALADEITTHYRRHDSNTTRDPIHFAEEFARVFEKHLKNPTLPSGACIQGVGIMLRPVVQMTRWRAPHRAIAALFRMLRARLV